MQSRRLSPLDVLMLVTALAVALMFIPSALSMSDEADKLKVCTSNLRILMQCQYIYAQDGDYFPAMAKPRTTNDGAMVLFAKETRDTAPAPDAIPSPTVDLWALLRSKNCKSKHLVCPLTKDTPDVAEDVTQHFDFESADNLSYSYHYQYDPDRPTLGTMSDQTIPLMADANPYLKGGIKDALKDRAGDGKGNSLNHGKSRPSQSVAFLDGHVQIVKSPDVGKSGTVDKKLLPKAHERDNIYTVHEKDSDVDPGSAAPTSTKCNLGSKSDSCLVP